MAAGLALVLGCGAGHFSTADAEAIEALLHRQQQAWNRGDVEAFMDGYWRSAQMTFSSGAVIERGWDATLERYQTRYPDAATMGQLAFDIEEIRPLSADAAVVLGRFTLTETSEAGTGVFTLVVRRRAEGWRIVHDHTSGGSIPSAELRKTRSTSRS